MNAEILRSLDELSGLTNIATSTNFAIIAIVLMGATLGALFFSRVPTKITGPVVVATFVGIFISFWFDHHAVISSAADAHCPIVLEAIESGQIAMLDNFAERGIVTACGRRDLLLAANSPASRLSPERLLAD